MQEVVIASAVRTPIGSFQGVFNQLPAHQLGEVAIRAALERAKTAPQDIQEVVMGQILTAGAGQNPARQAAMAAGIPVGATAYVLNQMCGSGLRAVVAAYQSIRLGDQDMVVAGGQESMSQSPHCIWLRPGVKMGDAPMVDTMIHDGLWDAFHHYHMGITAENLARQFNISRQQQDEFALFSQQKAEQAIKNHLFQSEIVPVPVKNGKIENLVTADEYPKAGVSLELLAKLRPAFDREKGTVTAGNASGLNDGAAAMVLMSKTTAVKKGIKPLARIVSWATAGVEPALMGTGPIPASRLALQRAGWKMDQLDLIEANEAFAVQSCVVNQEMKWDKAKVNVNGGAIALGHPIGASGARILVTLLHEMVRRKAKRGLATLCIGGGMGIAMCVERE